MEGCGTETMNENLTAPGRERAGRLTFPTLQATLFS